MKGRVLRRLYPGIKCGISFHANVFSLLFALLMGPVLECWANSRNHLLLEYVKVMFLYVKSIQVLEEM